ncbi:MAG: type II toxin-antitoxin system HicB family antitoxin [Rhodocyclaceae bacterium]|nr:type II toxin-antitoxin system HicB family antitoxin [Rhodocyclaceae bacterium]
MRYMVVIEKGASSYGAFVPDLPGCMAVGETEEETTTLIQEAIQFHLEGLQLEGHLVPPPCSKSTFIEVPFISQQPKNFGSICKFAAQSRVLGDLAHKAAQAA